MTPSTQDEQSGAHWLRLGTASLERGEREAAAQALHRALAEPPSMLAAHNLIEQHRLDGCFADMMGLDCRIAAADDIFRFFLCHPTSRNPLRDYLADGWRSLSELMLLLERARQPLLGMGSVLEFAAGHGRFTRHLAQAMGPERITVSDIVPDAVAFSRSTFGVNGFVSAPIPEDVAWPRRYDLVFVLSLFSHLPRKTWGRWLRQLFTAVEPGGLLVFSAHGLKAARHDHVELDDEGFFFAASSESQAIDVQEYGTSFTSEAFVRARIAEHVGADKLVHHAPLQFWNHQDAYVLRA